MPQSMRKKAVDEGRAMVRVRNPSTGDLATAGVCPACWNIAERRPSLLAQLSRMGWEPVHKADLADGVYRPRSMHAPGCRHADLSGDPWDRLKQALKGVKRK
jgi:hypothetical protein